MLIGSAGEASPFFSKDSPWDTHTRNALRAAPRCVSSSGTPWGFWRPWSSTRFRKISARRSSAAPAGWPSGPPRNPMRRLDAGKAAAVDKLIGKSQELPWLMGNSVGTIYEKLQNCGGCIMLCDIMGILHWMGHLHDTCIEIGNHMRNIDRNNDIGIYAYEYGHVDRQHGDSPSNLRYHIFRQPPTNLFCTVGTL